MLSEQVSDGHPDKICDQIADAVLTECLKHDPESRVAIECMAKDNIIVMAGEISSEYWPDTDALAHNVLTKIGVPRADQYLTTAFITPQSPDIARGVDVGGAGDQGVMYGYATDETDEYMPLPYMLATKALQYLRALHSPLLLPDAKAQVTYDYTARRIDTFLLSTQHREEADLRDVRETVRGVMIDAAKDYGLNTDFKVLVNPTGRFVKGGTFADTGVTGRKLMCDTYGGLSRHGGGAFSGKDPTKVDRSGAYMARKIAKDFVRNGFARRCEVQLAYAIGVKKPVSVSVNCLGTGRTSEKEMARIAQKYYDLTPEGIIETLDLKHVDYTQTAAYGHFGKYWLPWER